MAGGTGLSHGRCQGDVTDGSYPMSILRIWRSRSPRPGVQNAVEKAKPVLLEPVMNMEVSVPDECLGDVIGDLNSRRGKVLCMDTKGHIQAIKTQVPMAEVLKYAGSPFDHQRPGRVPHGVLSL
jgi:elongation factor G